MASIQAYCSQCGKTVTVLTMLDDNGVKRALANNEKIQVIHTVGQPDGTSKDHRWELNGEQAENLARHLGRSAQSC